MEQLSIALLSGVGAGLVAILATIAIERLGGRLGGIIGTLPTTIIPASWGLWYQSQEEVLRQTSLNTELTQNTLEQFSIAMYAVPAGMCLNAIFLWLWRVIPQGFTIVSRLSEQGQTGLRKALALMSLMTLGLWFISAFTWVTVSKKWLNTLDLHYLSGVSSLLLIVLIGLAATYQSVPAPKGKKISKLSTLFSRGVCAMLAVTLAVLIAKSGASTFAGVAAVFPAIFWTTMVSLWLSQGQAVPSGAVGPMMLGSSSVAVFALAAPSSYLEYGPLWGALLAWLLALFCAALPSYLWIKRAH